MHDDLRRAGRAWADAPKGQRRLAALRALCDTWVPATRPPRGAGPLDGFWTRRASALDTHLAVAGWLATRAPAEDLAGVEQLLDLLAVTGFRHLPPGARELELAALGAVGEIGEGLADVRALALALHYALPTEEGPNPAWPVLGYPGPPDIAAEPRERLRTTSVSPFAAAVELDADVCIVGSGAGGSVIAALLAEAGLDVVVLEAGGDPQEDDFPRHEIEAMTSLYWRDGFVARTEDRNVTVMAGATLGGGTTVNWTACVPPPARVRKVWADEHGLRGLDGSDFDDHLDAVLERIGATEACSDPNGPNEALRRGAEAIGWSWHPAMRNADAAAYDPASAGHMGFGDRSGSKRGTLRTYLADAVASGARVVPRCRADRIAVTLGRATGVEATVHQGGGAATRLTVRASTVVVAGGALETPALLLRSGIGGPATGRFLRLHPVGALIGFYPEAQRAWWGAPLTSVVDEFSDLTDGHGFLVECPHYGTGLSAGSLPWRTGRDHKLLMGKLDHGASFIGLVRDRGAGQVTVDDAGEAVVCYPLDDPLDRAHLGRALEVMARLHVAAGATGLLDLAPGRPFWRRGQDLEGWLASLGGTRFGAGGRSVFSAHQMGSARMGPDPASSVADPEGQLHDTSGVWVGDTSAFPTAVGSNPMVTCMALARRTAHAILAARP
jgi:choline dehydrogenase-like flavoprotein